MEEIVRIIPMLTGALTQGNVFEYAIQLFSIITPLLAIIAKLFNPANKVIGLEDYKARVKARLKDSIVIIMIFIIFTILLGTYSKWMPNELNPNKEGEICTLGFLYFVLGFVVFLMWLIVVAIIHKFTKNTITESDKCDKSESIRYVLYSSLGFIFMGWAIIIQDSTSTIISLMAILFLGVIILILFDHEADKALLYYKSSGRVVYIYRAIDNDNLLCGTDKNALSCKFYIIKNKNYVFKEKLYVVDKDNVEEKSKKSIDISKKIVEIFNKYKNSFSISIVVSAIIIMVVFYFKKEIEKNIVTRLIIVVSILLAIIFIKKIVVFMRDFLLCIKKLAAKSIKIVTFIIYILFLISVGYLFNKTFSKEWILHFLMLSLAFTPLIHKFLDCLKNKVNTKRVDKNS